MNWPLLISIVWFCFVQCIEAQQEQVIDGDYKETPPIINEKTYAKLFIMRRKENKDLLGIIVSEGIYERKYRLVDAAYGKILKILQEARSILLSNKYDPMVDKFPTKDRQLIDAITVTLENTCLFGEIILHMPDMSYRILALREQTDNDSQSFNWRELINWCIKYARYFNDRIIDSKGQELLSLLEQEINPDKRSADYINPYRDRSNTELDKNLNKKKHSKRLKRGPQLSRREDL